MRLVQDTSIGNELPDAEFVAIVEKDLLSSASEGERSMLRAVEAVERWHTTLVNLKIDVERQLSQRKAALLDLQQRCLVEGRKQDYFDAKALYESWKAKAARHKQNIEARLGECKRRRQQINDDEYAARADKPASRVELAIGTNERLDRIISLLERIAQKLG